MTHRKALAFSTQLVVLYMAVPESGKQRRSVETPIDSRDGRCNKMTKKEILSMEKGAELDALIHERVFGEKVLRVGNKNFPRSDKEKFGIYRCVSCGYEGPVSTAGFDVDTLSSICFNHCAGKERKPLYGFLNQYLQPYSTSISAAWLVVDKLEHHEFRMINECHNGKWCWYCGIEQPEDLGEGFFSAQAERLPEAICKAALLTKLEATE